MTTTLGLTFLLGGAMIATVVVLSLGLLTLLKKGKEAEARSLFELSQDEMIPVVQLRQCTFA